MALISDLFDKLRDTVGTPALVLVAWAFIFLEFGRSALALYKDPVVVLGHEVAGNRYLAVLAAVLFALGVCVGLLHVMQTAFNINPGRAFVQGIAAGICAGLAAGAIYGKFEGGLFEGWNVGLVLQSVLLSIPPGAVFGLVLSFCDPRATLSLGGRIAAVVIFGTGVMVPVGFLVVAAGLSQPGAVVAFWTVEVGVGVFVLVEALIWLRPLPAKVRYARLVVLGVLLLAFGWIVPWLARFPFSDAWLNQDRRQVGMEIGFLPFWSGILYLALTANTWFTRWLDRLVAEPATAVQSPPRP